MTVIRYILVILLSYVLGCSNMALYLSKLRGVDMRKGGSGNLGASNAMILMGWKAGIIVAVHDIGKAGVACVLGHMFPFYLRFRGGKGLASYLGMTIALNWKFALIVLAVVAIVTLITDYIVVGTVTTVILVPTYFGITAGSVLLASILCVATVAIIIKHKENYVRIFNGTEIGLRRANRGDDRVK